MNNHRSIFRVLILNKYPGLISSAGVEDYDDFYDAVLKIAKLVGFDKKFDKLLADYYINDLSDYIEKNKELYSFWIL